MNTITLSIHHLCAIWPRIQKRAVTVAFGTAVGIFLIWVDVPGSLNWQKFVGFIGRWVLAITWGLLAVSVTVMVCRDRLGDQFQFFQTRPVSRRLRIGVSLGAALCTVLLLAVAPVFVGAWFYNFPPGWQAIAGRWITIGLVGFLPLLALLWSRSRDGWVGSRILLTALGVFLSYAVFLEVRAWIPAESFLDSGSVAQWAPLLVLVSGSAWMLFWSLRKHGGLPRFAFVGFGVILASSLALLGLAGSSKSSPATKVEREFPGWQSALDGSEATVLLSYQPAITFSLPEYDGRARMVRVGFQGHLTAGDGTRLADASGVYASFLKTDDPKAVLIPNPMDFANFRDSETLLPMARLLGLKGEGSSHTRHQSGRIKVNPNRSGVRSEPPGEVFLTVRGEWPEEEWVDDKKNPGALTRELFLDGHLEISYQEIREIFRGPISEKLTARVPGMRVRVSPIHIGGSDDMLSLRVRILYSNPDYRHGFQENVPIRFAAFLKPAGPRDVGWMGFDLPKVEGAGWLAPAGANYRIDQRIPGTFTEPTPISDWLDGAEVIVVAQPAIETVRLPVRMPLRLPSKEM